MDLLSNIAAALVSSSVASLIIGSLLARRTERVKQEVLAEFQRLAETVKMQRSWQERAVAELLAPVAMQLGRTKRAFGRWKTKNVYLESKVIRDGNLAIRNALLEKPHLIPTALVEHAHRLVEHYDRWLEEFDRLRGDADRKLDEPFVFVGPEGYPFPHDAEAQFVETYKKMWSALYDEDVPQRR